MCNALDRLGFASSGELAAFWDSATAAEAKAWCRTAEASGAIRPVQIEAADGSVMTRFIRSETLDSLDLLGEAPGMVRVLSPFDPMIRDRKRCERLFGFNFRIEIFTPAAKRRYGYYVFPVLEGTRLIGRIDTATDKPNGALSVTAFWPEAGIKLGRRRMDKIEAALMRTARLCGMSHLTWRDGWRRDTLAPDTGVAIGSGR